MSVSTEYSTSNSSIRVEELESRSCSQPLVICRTIRISVKIPLLNQSAKVGFSGSSIKKSVPTPLQFEASRSLFVVTVYVHCTRG